ncbi:hypothetical protein QBC40DRAFT_266732 [Triangularia verruculosa]|uniref:HhH-GPD domain-containing protein n=1 Tax=Triangularia verruculosa TaxID=2587418 RepID=A0AAN6XE21_9PEZI|nr:hypothetical protein QBC40DRAFT_266732 [Triangularia verruculosa]
MQTRGAARRAAQAVATAVSGDAATSSLQTAEEPRTGSEGMAVDTLGSAGGHVFSATSESEDLPGSAEFTTPSDIVPSPTASGTKRKLGETAGELSETKTSVKRTRQAKKTIQPIKGGWVLPHGMGSATPNSAVKESPAFTESSAATQSLALEPTAAEITSVDAESEGFSIPSGSSLQNSDVDENPDTPDSESLSIVANPAPVVTRSTKKAAPKRATPKRAAPRKAAAKKAAPKTAARQPRVGFRVSKASAQTKTAAKVEKSNQLKTIVKQEEATEAVSSIPETGKAGEAAEKIAVEVHATHQVEASARRTTRFQAAALSQIDVKQEEAANANTITTETGSAVENARTVDNSQPPHQEAASSLRVTRSRINALTQTAVKHEHETPDHTLIVTKKEVIVQVETSSAANTRKLLIIRGVTLNGNVVSKSLDKIIVDVSQILNPDYRINVKRGTLNPYGLTPGYSPYPYRRVPTAEACEEVHRILTEMHGEVNQPDRIPAASLEIAGCGEVPCVLDALLRTLISGNTLMAMADAAIKKLGEDFGIRTEGTGAGSINWEKVRVSSHQALVNSIKISGNGPKKAQHIKLILDKVYEENLERVKQAGTAEKNEDGIAHDLLSLDYMHAMSKDEAMEKFVSFPGIGIKTAACVSLFCLRMPCFAVDTHVHKFCRWLGWTPVKADPDNVFRHGDFMVPDHLKYGLHQLFIRHGQTCFKCRKTTKPGSKDWNEAPDCPLEHLLDRSKDEAKPPKPKKPRKATIKEEDDEESGDAAVAAKTAELDISDAEHEDEVVDETEDEKVNQAVDEPVIEGGKSDENSDEDGEEENKMKGVDADDEEEEEEDEDEDGDGDEDEDEDESDVEMEG